MPRLPAAHAHVPGLRDQLGAADRGIRHGGDQERVAGGEAVRGVPAQRRCQIEAEAVDVADLDPVAQGVQRHAHDLGAGEVQRVAAARDVEVVAAVVVAVPLPVPQPAPAVGLLAHARLCGVVVDDVQDDLDARCVQVLDHLLELVDGPLRSALLRGAGGIGPVRGEEGQRVVAPVVAQPAGREMRLVQMGVHRQQLDGGDAQRAQVLDHHGVGEACVRSAQLLRNARVVDRQALDMGLVDHGVAPGDVRGEVPGPVEGVVDDLGDVAAAVGVRLGDPALSGCAMDLPQPPTVGVQQDLLVQRGGAVVEQRRIRRHEAVEGPPGHGGAAADGSRHQVEVDPAFDPTQRVAAPAATGHLPDQIEAIDPGRPDGHVRGVLSAQCLGDPERTGP